ncbi:preprotein translocase subunit SecE [Pseudonocardia sp.]|uniref:preprotein translocase subunit SecE n=1 Tax=Pseudonocardia sp. TaxID=60912 RepID=UPI002ED9EF2C
MTEERESEREGRDRPATAADRRGPSVAAEIDGRKGRPTPARDGRAVKVSLLARLTRFLREVVAELRKVIWPTRKDLVTYTIVVLVFVSFMVALVALLDYVFAKGVFAVFGNA